MGIEGVFDHGGSSALGRRVVLMVGAKNLQKEAEFGDEFDLPLRTHYNVSWAYYS